MPGATSSSSTTQQQYPKFVEDFGKDFFKDANKAFNKGPHYFKGDTTTPMANQTMAGLGYEYGPDGKMRATGGGMMGLANANSGSNGMGGNLQQIMSNGGFNPGQLDSMSSIKELTQNPFMNSLINGNGLTQDQNAVSDFYRTGMNEQFGTDANYNRVKQDALDSSAQGVNALAAKMGRFGGGANQNILSRNQGSLAASMDTAELDKYRARTNAAAGNLASLSGTGVSQHGSAVDRKSGLESTLFNMNQTGLDNMGKAYQTAQMPYQTQREVGQQFEDLYTRQMQDKLRKFDAKNPFNHLQQYSSLLSGAPMNTVQTQNPSWTNTILGGLMAGSAFI